MSEVKRAFCRLCDKGFPIKGGVHYGTQSLGMIPSRVCDNASPEESAKWIVESSSANSAEYDEGNYFIFKSALKNIADDECDSDRQLIAKTALAAEVCIPVRADLAGDEPKPNYPRAIALLRLLREATDPAEIQRQKDSWAALEESLIQGEGTAGSLNPASYEDYPDTELAEAPIPRYQELVANASPAGKLWATWFERMSEHATIDTVNATANLVIAERELIINEHDSLREESAKFSAHIGRRLREIASAFNVPSKGGVSADCAEKLYTLADEFDLSKRTKQAPSR